MIKKMSHTSVFVLNQEEALKFYRDQLGFQVHTDAMVGDDFRFLTLNVKDEPGFEIILMEPRAGMLMDQETAAQLRAIIEKGVLGAGAFHTDDCQATYEELKSRGVEFIQSLLKDRTASRPYSRIIPKLVQLMQPNEEYSSTSAKPTAVMPVVHQAQHSSLIIPLPNLVTATPCRIAALLQG